MYRNDVSNKINEYKKENKKMEDIKKEENKIKISEAEIEKFIRENDKRKETVLIDYKDLIIRLMGTGISKKKIYEFIYEKDNSIGKQINFYKYIERNIENKTKSKKIKSEIEKPIEQKEIVKTEVVNKTTVTASQTTETKKEDDTLVSINKTATSKLSDDYDLLADVEMRTK